jgi:hypothetical protein
MPRHLTVTRSLSRPRYCRGRTHRSAMSLVAYCSSSLASRAIAGIIPSAGDSPGGHHRRRIHDGRRCEIQLVDLEEAIPAFLFIAMMPSRKHFRRYRLRLHILLLSKLCRKGASKLTLRSFIVRFFVSLSVRK